VHGDPVRTQAEFTADDHLGLIAAAEHNAPSQQAAAAIAFAAAQIGRPYVWGLAIDGQAGVEHVLRCLLAELDLTLALSGHTSTAEIDRRSVSTRP